MPRHLLALLAALFVLTAAEQPSCGAACLARRAAQTPGADIPLDLPLADVLSIASNIIARSDAVPIDESTLPANAIFVPAPRPALDGRPEGETHVLERPGAFLSRGLYVQNAFTSPLFSALVLLEARHASERLGLLQPTSTSLGAVGEVRGDRAVTLSFTAEELRSYLSTSPAETHPDCGPLGGATLAARVSPQKRSMWSPSGTFARAHALYATLARVRTTKKYLGVSTGTRRALAWVEQCANVDWEGAPVPEVALKKVVGGTPPRVSASALSLPPLTPGKDSGLLLPPLFAVISGDKRPFFAHHRHSLQCDPLLGPEPAPRSGHVRARAVSICLAAYDAVLSAFLPEARTLLRPPPPYVPHYYDGPEPRGYNPTPLPALKGAMHRVAALGATELQGALRPTKGTTPSDCSSPCPQNTKEDPVCVALRGSLVASHAAPPHGAGLLADGKVKPRAEDEEELLLEDEWDATFGGAKDVDMSDTDKDGNYRLGLLPSYLHGTPLPVPANSEKKSWEYIWPAGPVHYNNVSSPVEMLATEFILTKYPSNPDTGGARYVAHIDESPLASGQWPRVVTFVWYLGGAAGGELRAHLGGGKRVDIAPRADRLVLFPAQYLRHEVMPAESDRFALTGWFRARAAPADEERPLY